MIYIEISKSCGDYNFWTPSRIKKAFNAGNGTTADLMRYYFDNSNYIDLVRCKNKKQAEAYIKYSGAIKTK